MLVHMLVHMLVPESVPESVLESVPESGLGRHHNFHDKLSACSRGLTRTHQWQPNTRSTDYHLCMALLAPMLVPMLVPVSAPVSVPVLVPVLAWTTQ